MYRSFTISAPPAASDGLLASLERLDQVVSLSIERGASVKPPGDVITVHSLNSRAGDVLRAADEAHAHGQVSIATADVASLVDREHAEAIVKDTDEALWEETEAGVRHQSRPTHNYLLLMAAGGAVAATGFLSTPPTQTIAFVSASVMAPGFEPLAKVPLAIVLRRWTMLVRGLRSALLGYLVIIVMAALSYLLLEATGAATLKNFVGNKEIDKLANPTSLDILVSSCAAVAGVTMVASRRFALLAGPLIALALIPSAAMVGVSAAAGEADLVAQASLRLGIDVALVFVFGLIVAGLKQLLVHRRRPLR
ncbi:MAG: DUF389 domain-containing protein [Thermoleophilaceae bacterium]|nr:DUF389 domain-containing protein [Thermoleophilaceae bacterium]MBA3839221.1 DUF389 domain-containing protein [Thermoleophilaceae bacterium]